MKSLVVYESEYGNTERIARDIAKALGEHGEARFTPVGTVATLETEDLDVLVVGAPTQRHGCRSLSKSCSRAPRGGLSRACGHSLSTRATGGRAGSQVLQLERSASS